jgi:hypothetical protein
MWDSKSDLAVLSVLAPNNQADLFRDMFWLDNQSPQIGDEVMMRVSAT